MTSFHGKHSQFTRIFGFSVQFILVGLLFFTRAEDEISATECKALMTKLVKGQLTKVKDCLNEMEFKTGQEKSEKMLCVFVCAMQRSGFLDAESRLDAAASLSFLESELPPSIRDKVLDAFVECHEHLGKIITPAEDPYCKSYDQLMKCAQNSVNKVC